MSDKKLYQGDCLEIMKQISDKSIDMILCDLPYGITACKWDTIIPFDKLWEQYNRIIKDNGIIILFGSEPFSSLLRCSNLKMYRYDYVWIKNNCGNFQLANKNPLKYHENISVFYKDIIHTDFSTIIKEQMQKNNLTYDEVSSLFLSKNNNKTGWLFNKIKGTQIPTKKQWEKMCELFNYPNEYDKIIDNLKKHTFNIDYIPTKVKHSNKNKGGNLGHFSSINEEYIQTKSNYIKSTLYYKRVSKPVHPTQKPVDLLEWLIKTYSNEGDIILDNCMGSGSTGVACKLLKRNFIGIELDEKYFKIAEERIANTNKKGLF